MKKIIIALAVLLSVQFADAQVKPAAAARKAVEAAETASKDPKKATKVATWLKLAKAYEDAYNSPKGNAMNMLGMGLTQQEVALNLAGEKPLSVEKIVLGGEPCTKEVYPTRDYIYNKNGQFFCINVKRPLYEDPLGEALKAYVKAYEVDAKKSKLKDINEGISKISKDYFEDAITAYTFGDNAAASALFAKAAEASATAPYSQLNAEAFYNAGFTALASGSLESAKTYFEKCLENNYYHEGGDVYSKLASIYEKYAQAEDAKAKEAGAAVKQFEEDLRSLEVKVQNFSDQEKRIRLNESDIIAKGKRATKKELADKAKFAAERLVLADSIARLNAQIESLDKSKKDAEAVVAEYEAAAMKQREFSRNYLEAGFAKYPQSQVILIGLINYYLESKQDPSRLFELIAAAKANEPNNASLYYVEGNIYNELRQAIKGDTEDDLAKRQQYFDSAVNAYDECVKVSPEYEFGYIGKGLLYYNYAIELQDKASTEMNQAKYEAILAQMEDALQNALNPFESAYNISKDNALRVNIAEYLKNIYYRFYSKGAEYEEGYKKYNEVVKSGQAK